MYKITLIVVLLIAVLVILGLSSCFSYKRPHDVRNSKNSLDWEGVYTTSILSNEGHYIDIHITLKREQSFEIYYKYIDGSFDSFHLKGSFRWDDTGNIIIVEMIDVINEYKVVKDKLIRLDVDNFVLVKVK